MTLRLLADENIPGAMVSALRSGGHDVDWVVETRPGMSDEEILSQAARDARVVLTFDKDFGELAGTVMPGSGLGILLVRFRKPATAEDARSLVGILSARDDWAGFLSIVEPGRVRMRPLGPKP